MPLLTRVFKSLLRSTFSNRLRSLSPSVNVLHARTYSLAPILDSTPASKYFPALNVLVPTDTPSPLASTDEESPLSFMEEPLGLPASEGFGYYQGGPGDRLGPGGRFKLESKLGLGATSSVWMARDLSKDHHVAVKILTGYATRMNLTHELREFHVHRRLWVPPGAPESYCQRMIAGFITPGIDPEDGEHLCLAMDLLGSSVEELRMMVPYGVFSLPVVKHILRDVLRGMAHMHARGIVHTDLKPDNIMTGLQYSTATLDEWLKDTPPRTYPPEKSLRHMVTAYESQPLPPPLASTLTSHTFKIADFGCAQILSNCTKTNDITPLGMRPPEIILGKKWDEKIDVWTFGCLVFELLTGQPLFMPMGPPDKPIEHSMLYQMLCFCGESFDEDYLKQCSQASQYFTKDGLQRLKELQTLDPITFQERIRETCLPIAPADIEGASALMKRCLRLDPANRASAQELLQDPWLAH